MYIVCCGGELRVHVFPSQLGAPVAQWVKCLPVGLVVES